MATFTERLQKCVSKADLTASDAARWFKRPRTTVLTWIEGRIPWGRDGEVACRDLELLEWAVKSDPKLPIPGDLSWQARKVYLNERYEHAARNASVPSLRSPA